jgi:MFS family permease
MVVMHAIYGLTAYPVGRLSDAFGRTALLFISLVVLVAAYLVLALASFTSTFLLGIVLWGLHMGLSQGLLAALIADTAPANLKGTAFGMFNLATGIVVLIGNIAAGFLWDSYGSRMTFLVGAAISLLALSMFAFASVRHRLFVRNRLD